MNEVELYEEVLKNLIGSLETIKNLTDASDDSNWLAMMDQIKSTAQQGLNLINTYADKQKMPGVPDPFSIYATI